MPPEHLDCSIADRQLLWNSKCSKGAGLQITGLRLWPLHSTNLVPSAFFSLEMSFYACLVSVINWTKQLVLLLSSEGLCRISWMKCLLVEVWLVFHKEWTNQFSSSSDFVRNFLWKVKLQWIRKRVKVLNFSRLHYIFFISNLGFCLQLGLPNTETEIGTRVA